jgi:2-keto-4-pentenoate hydratase/2-oxohepta-3-ene-1,7-dioic acid hydratase in catechol pathway
MRFLSYELNGQPSFGALVDEKICDFGLRYPALDLRQAIREDKLTELAREAERLDGNISSDEITYLPTIPNPEKIICIGVNYANRNAEYKDDSDAPKYPSVFMRSRESLVGHLAPIFDPPESAQLDYEGEIVLIVGRGGRRISEARAHEHVAGISIMNEGSVRDWLRHAKFNVTQGKNFVGSGGLGPWMVTPDEVDPMSNLRVQTHVNGEARQDDVTDNLMFPFRYLVSYLSTFYQLNPGDVIATGTPNGAGARFDPPKFLAAGDVVEVTVSGVGTLKNEVADEPS